MYVSNSMSQSALYIEYSSSKGAIYSYNASHNTRITLLFFELALE